MYNDANMSICVKAIMHVCGDSHRTVAGENWKQLQEKKYAGEIGMILFQLQLTMREVQAHDAVMRLQ